MLVKQLLFNLSVILLLNYDYFVYARTNNRSSICPNGWKTFNKKCYILHGDLLGANLYDSHSVICPTIYKARLLTIRSEEEQTFVTSHLYRDKQIQFGVWIGAFRSERGFIWLDGSGNELEYTNWQTGQPRNYNGTEYCAALSMEEHEMGKWHDVFCTDRYLVMCEITIDRNGSTVAVIKRNVAKTDLESKLAMKRVTNMIWDFHVAILVFMALIILTILITYLLTSACDGYRDKRKKFSRGYNRNRLALITVLFVYF